MNSGLGSGQRRQRAIPLRCSSIHDARGGVLPCQLVCAQPADAPDPSTAAHGLLVPDGTHGYGNEPDEPGHVAWQILVNA